MTAGFQNARPCLGILLSATVYPARNRLAVDVTRRHDCPTLGALPIPDANRPPRGRYDWVKAADCQTWLRILACRKRTFRISITELPEKPPFGVPMLSRSRSMKRSTTL